MSETYYISNVSASLERNVIILKWNWARECIKVDVNYLWKDGFSEIFREEYKAQENQFIYNAGPADFGNLDFKLVPYFYDETKRLKASDEAVTITVTSQPQDIIYDIEEKTKLITLSEFKTVYINLKCNMTVMKEALSYRKSTSKNVYCFPVDIKQGESRWGPIFIKKNETISLRLEEEYRGMYRLKSR